MYYLIDGYNLLFWLIESKQSLQSQRQSIILSLQKEFKYLHLKGTLVFDGAHRADEQSGLSYRSPLIIAYSHSGESADQYILEKLETSPGTSEIIVVTNDRFVSSHARGFGAQTLSLKAFVSQLKKKVEKKLTQQEETLDERPFKEPQKEIDRLSKIFEERLAKGSAD